MLVDTEKPGKNEMIRVVSMLLRVTEPLQADAADATAIAMTHLMLANLPNLNDTGGALVDLV